MFNWVFKFTSEYKRLRRDRDELEKHNIIFTEELNKRGHVFFIENKWLGFNKKVFGFVQDDGNSFVYRSELK